MVSTGERLAKVLVHAARGACAGSRNDPATRTSSNPAPKEGDSFSASPLEQTRSSTRYIGIQFRESLGGATGRIGTEWVDRVEPEPHSLRLG